jgi:hypothetical protein
VPDTLLELHMVPAGAYGASLRAAGPVVGLALLARPLHAADGLPRYRCFSASPVRPVPSGHVPTTSVTALQAPRSAVRPGHCCLGTDSAR